MITSGTIFESTECLITLINLEYDKLLKTDLFVKICSNTPSSTEFYVRASIFSANVDTSLYIKVSNYRGTKFFVDTETGDILDVERFNLPITGAIGNVLTDDYGFSSIKRKIF